MNGFRNYNKDTGRFEGKPYFKGVNGLFDKFDYNDEK